MQNYVQRGIYLDFVAPENVVSGQGVAIGDMFCVSTKDLEQGELGSFVTTGVVKLPKLLTDTFEPGAKVYWDGVQITTDDTSNTFAGYYVGAEGNLALVRLPL